MRDLKNKIIKLRAKGNSYKKICKLLKCSRGTVAYHCGTGQKEKAHKRSKKTKEHSLGVKINSFNSVKKGANEPKTYNPRQFSLNELKTYIGENPICYLTGRKIDLNDGLSYHLDHIIPKSRGGDNSLQNLGITCAAANQAKNNLMLEELLQLCYEILLHHGYTVTPPDSSFGAVP